MVDERVVVTARMARLAARQRAVATAYARLMDRPPASEDEGALDTWRRDLDALYAKKDAIVAQRMDLRRRLSRLSDTEKAA